MLDPNLFGIEVHQPAVKAQSAGTEEALVDSRRAENVGAEFADERHRLQAQKPAGDENVDSRCVRECGCDQQPVCDNDELLLRAQLERQVVGRGARIERDRLTVLDHRRGGLRDRLLALGLQAKTEIEAQLGVAALQGPNAAPDARHEATPCQRRQIAPDRHLGH